MSFTFILWPPWCFGTVWTARCGLTPWEGALVRLLGGSTLRTEDLDTLILSVVSLPVEAKMKWKNNICEACFMYMALCLDFYLLREIT